jgi:hypothetical protein
VLRIILLVLATFWAWETVRYPVERYAGQLFSYSRPLHPLIVAAFPLYVLWPDWVAGLGVAGATGLAVGLVDRYLGSGGPAVPVQLPRRRNSLPPLP